MMTVDSADYQTLHQKWRAACAEAQAERDANVLLRRELARYEQALIRWHRADGTLDFCDADESLAELACALTEAAQEHAP